MVTGSTFPAGTVLLTVNPKHATDAGCSVRDRQKAGNYSSRASAHGSEGEREAGTRKQQRKSHRVSLRPPNLNSQHQWPRGLGLSEGFSRLGLQMAVAMQKGKQRGEDSERSDR